MISWNVLRADCITLTTSHVPQFYISVPISQTLQLFALRLLKPQLYTSEFNKWYAISIQTSKNKFSKRRIQINQSGLYNSTKHFLGFCKSCPRPHYKPFPWILQTTYIRFASRTTRRGISHNSQLNISLIWNILTVLYYKYQFWILVHYFLALCNGHHENPT